MQVPATEQLGPEHPVESVVVEIDQQPILEHHRGVEDAFERFFFSGDCRQHPSDILGPGDVCRQQPHPGARSFDCCDRGCGLG